jgi:hypothetical protein
LIGKIKLDETYIFEIRNKSDSFDVSIGIKIPFFRVSVTIEPGCSLLTVRYHELFDYSLVVISIRFKFKL